MLARRNLGVTHKLIRTILLSLAGSLFLPSQLCAQDLWTTFHPEVVLSHSCKVESIIKYRDAETPDQEIYESIAMAKRTFDSTTVSWDATIAEMPLTPKGYREAWKACEDWMEQAGKKVRAAKGIVNSGLSARWSAKER